MVSEGVLEGDESLEVGFRGLGDGKLPLSQIITWSYLSELRVRRLEAKAYLRA